MARYDQLRDFAELAWPQVLERLPASTVTLSRVGSGSRAAQSRMAEDPHIARRPTPGRVWYPLACRSGTGKALVEAGARSVKPPMVGGRGVPRGRQPPLHGAPILPLK